ncbi:DedA family protein [Ktedonosporobacter rubrisoli]|uniref:DedA family protein n=1 Tax=Ktedonosporobacter rubrisoli TaxID=2509675 RepID=A0A4P6JVP2_KTERU|nr:DedA family protein [Ktedonosporobacter rubrisoli]QBD79422.1 DedA family protein [Ktedonosporobacter rubrisoli]
MLTQLTNILITSIANIYIETGLLGIFLIMALENCYIPLPASEVVIPIAGALVVRGALLPTIPVWASIVLVSLACALGCLAGSMAAYAIGSTGGRQILLKYGRYILISQREIERAEQFFQQRGSAAVFYSRLLPVVRTWASLPAGFTRMPFKTFCLYTFGGSLLWCALWTCLGAFMGNNLDQLKPISHILTGLVLALCTLLIALYIGKHIRTVRHAH